MVLRQEFLKIPFPFVQLVGSFEIIEPMSTIRPSLCRLSDLEAICHSHKLGKGLGAELFHQVMAMNLHGDFADAHLRRDLLVHQACADQCHNLALAGAERFISRS